MTMIRPEILEIKDWLIETRRDIHRHPELAFQEVRTAGVVRKYLEEWGLEVRDQVGRTGVVGVWKADREGPCVGFRADMDALPIEEGTGLDCASTVPGLMHACGHDLHTTMLLGVARTLALDPEAKKRLRGAVKFIFQPGEEGANGASAMINDGALDHPPMDVIFAAHVAPDFPVGQVSLCKGAAMASVDDLYIAVKGRGGHAAMPELALDPIAPAAELTLKIRDIHHRLDRAITGVCAFNAGTATNVIPDKVEMKGTFRAFDPEIQQIAHDQVREAAAQVEKATGVEVRVNIVKNYPILFNDDASCDQVIETAGEMLGRDNVVLSPPRSVSEDFAFFLQKVPGALYWLGCGGDGEDAGALHNPGFNPSEDTLPYGVELMVRLFQAYLTIP